MFTLLKIPNEKIKDKKIQEVKQRVTSIKNELGYKVDNEEVKKESLGDVERFLSRLQTICAPSQKCKSGMLD